MKGWIMNRLNNFKLTFLLIVLFILGASNFSFAIAQDLPIKDIDPTSKEDKAKELIDKIKKGLEKIDENLLNANSSDIKGKMKENISNIEKLLKDTHEQSSKVIGNLDELIKSIKYKK